MRNDQLLQLAQAEFGVRTVSTSVVPSMLMAFLSRVLGSFTYYQGKGARQFRTVSCEVCGKQLSPPIVERWDAARGVRGECEMVVVCRDNKLRGESIGAGCIMQ